MNQLLALGILFLSLAFEFIRTLSPRIPGVFSYVVDMTVAVIAVIVVARIIVTRSWHLIPPKYIVVFLGFVYVCIAGAILNDESGDTVFAGIRIFFRSVPIFLLPFAFAYDSNQWKQQLALVTAILIIQVPVSFWQRFVVFDGYVTGDGVVGTFATSSALAVLGSVGMLFLFIRFLNNQIKLGATLLLSLVMITPASLAETKVTPILLVVGGAAALWVMRKRLTMRLMLTALFIGSLGLGLFVTTYSILYSREDGAGYFEVMTDPRYTYTYIGTEMERIEIPRRDREDMLGSYNPTKSKGEVQQQVGRADGMMLPFKMLLPHAPLHMALGLGIGNISTDFGSGGEYWEYHDNLEATGTTISHLLWETGLAGLLLFTVFLSMVTLDCLRASKGDTELSSLGTAMFVTCSIAWISMAYTSLLFAPELMIPFCYFSGLVIATSRRENGLVSTDQRFKQERSSLLGVITAAPRS